MSTPAYDDGDSILPSQFDDRCGSAGTSHDPERMLRLSILQDALDVYLGRADAVTTYGRRDFFEAAQWIWSDDEAWPFSYRRLCDVLGLNPEVLRAGIEKNRQSGMHPDHRNRGPVAAEVAP